MGLEKYAGTILGGSWKTGEEFEFYPESTKTLSKCFSIYILISLL